MRLQDQLYAEQQRVTDELSRRVDPASVQRRLEALSNASVCVVEGECEATRPVVR